MNHRLNVLSSKGVVLVRGMGKLIKKKDQKLVCAEIELEKPSNYGSHR